MKPLVFQIDVGSLKDLNDADLLQLHREYWTFIAKHRIFYKPQIVNKNYKCLAVTSNCFLCEYAGRKQHAQPDTFTLKCNFCPAKFSLKHSCLGDAYSKWKDASFKVTRWWYARKLANIRFKPEVYAELKQLERK